MKQRVPTALRDRLRGMLIQPNQTMATVAPNLTEGALIVVGLIVTAGIRAALEVAYTARGNTVGFAIGGALIGIVMAWVSLALLLALSPARWVALVTTATCSS